MAPPYQLLARFGGSFDSFTSLCGILLQIYHHVCCLSISIFQEIADFFSHAIASAPGPCGQATLKDSGCASTSKSGKASFYFDNPSIDYFFVVCGIGNVKSHDAGCTLFCEAFVHYLFFIALIMAFLLPVSHRALFSKRVKLLSLDRQHRFDILKTVPIMAAAGVTRPLFLGIFKYLP